MYCRGKYIWRWKIIGIHHTSRAPPPKHFYKKIFHIWQAHFRPKDFGLTVLEGLIITDHSLTRSHYWSTRKLLAAGLPLWPGAPLLRQPGLLGLPQEDHVDANLSADANSTCTGCNQNSPPHIIPISDLPDAGLQELATLPVWRHQRKTTLSKLAINLTYTLYKIKFRGGSWGGGGYLTPCKNTWFSLNISSFDFPREKI